MMDIVTSLKIVRALHQAIVDRINKTEQLRAKIISDPGSQFHNHVLVTDDDFGYMQPIVLNNDNIQIGYIDEYSLSIADPNYIDRVVEITEQHFVEKVKSCQQQTGRTRSKS